MVGARFEHVGLSALTELGASEIKERVKAADAEFDTATIARLCERMRKFKLLAASSTESGEVENAERMYAKAQAEVQSRASTEDQFTLVGWAPR